MIDSCQTAGFPPKLFFLSAAEAKVRSVYEKEDKSGLCPLCGSKLKGERNTLFHRKFKSKRDVEATNFGVFFVNRQVRDRIRELSDSEVRFSQVAEDHYILRPVSRLLFDDKYDSTIESDGACSNCGNDLGRSALRVIHGISVFRAGSVLSDFGVYRTDICFGWAPQMEPLIVFGGSIAKTVEKEFSGAFFDECKFVVCQE
ncbi:MAG: hypothetical protein AAFP17_06820 [Pseudomonadota bacterium]